METRAPSAQTAADVFAGRWSCDLAGVAGVTGTGGADLFGGDPRPGWAAEAFGRGTGRLDGMRVLELGPLEAGHTYQLERLGAREVVAVDADPDAYLKCLVVKELLGLRRSRFLLGDALEYLRGSGERFDLVFCSGLLYELADPVPLIQACCAAANRCFVWTHYHSGEAGRGERGIEVDGFAATYYEQGDPARAWLTQAAVLDAFRHFGLDEITMFEDNPHHPNGAAMAFGASRPYSERFVRVTAPP